jgi:Uma2 family endonuclease
MDEHALGLAVRIPMHATDDDLLAIAADNEPWRFERDADGALLVMPPCGNEVDAQNAALTELLRRYAREHDYVAFGSSAGFTLPDGSIRNPDGALIARERWNAIDPKERKQFARVVPEVAIELVSPCDSPAALKVKLERFRRFGSRYVVLLDPGTREVWTSGDPPPDFPSDFSEVFAEP